MDFRKLRKRIQQAPDGARTSSQPDTPDQASLEDAPSQVEAWEGPLAIGSAVEDEGSADVATTPSTEDEDEYSGASAAFLEEETALIAEGSEVLRFRLAQEQFCLPLERISEIIKPREITPVPRTPDWLLGIVSLRGTMIPVIDTALRLKVRSVPVPTRRIIIIEHEGELCGLLVDEVQNVEIVADDAIEPLPAALADRAGQFLAGLLRLEEHLIAMIDIEAILELEGGRRQ